MQTEGILKFVPLVDGMHSFCFRPHQRGQSAALSLTVRTGERDEISTQIARKGTGALFETVVCTS